MRADRDKKSLFRGWSRLHRHAASLVAARSAQAGPGTPRAARIRSRAIDEAMASESEKEQRRGTTATSDGRGEVGGADTDAGAAPTPLDRAEKAEGVSYSRGGRLVRSACPSFFVTRVLNDVRSNIECEQVFL